MIEIKFRAWHIKRKKYYEILDLHIKTIWNGGIWATCLGYDIIEQKDICIDIQPNELIIEQYTGLKDKNHIEIYKGDVIKHGDSILTVEWFNYGFVLKDNDTEELYCLNEHHQKYYEILGNIHEGKRK